MASQKRALSSGRPQCRRNIYNAREESTEYILGVAETIFKRIGSFRRTSRRRKGKRATLNQHAGRV